MKVNEFISQYKNHPIVFMGAGMTQRYYKNAYNWDQLLSKLCYDLTEDEERYLNLKYENKNDLPLIASVLENEYDIVLKKDRNGKFKHINDVFFERLKSNKPQCSRMKLYLSTIISELKVRMTLKRNWRLSLVPKRIYVQLSQPIMILLLKMYWALNLWLGTIL